METPADAPPIKGLERYLPLLWPLPGIVIALWFFPRLAVFALYPLAFLVPFCAAVLLHEGAHAVAARLSGFDVTIFDSFPISARRGDQGWRLRRSSVFGPTGFVGIAPTDMPPDVFARRFRRMVLAGPMVSGLLLPVGAVASWWGVSSLFSIVGSARFAPTHGQLLLLLAGTSLLVGAVAGATTIIPARIGGMTSDGMTFKLLSDSRNAEIFQRLVQSTALTFGVRRPREWSVAEVEQLGHVVLGSHRTPLERDYHLNSTMQLALAYVDNRQPDVALKVTSQVVGPALGAPVVTELGLQLLFALQAYLLAFHRSAGAAPQAMLNQIPPRSPVRRTSIFLAAEALVAAGQGRRDDARRLSGLAKVAARRSARLTALGLVEIDMVVAARERMDAPVPVPLAPLDRIGPPVAESA